MFKVRLQSYAAAALMLALLCAPSQLVAQGKSKKPELDKVAGKVLSVEMKGKAAIVHIEKEDGEKLDVLVTPKIAVQVNGAGDKEFVRQNVGVSMENVAKGGNGAFFARTFTIYLGDRPPQVATQTTSGWNISGQITAVNDTGFTVNVNGSTSNVAFDGTDLTINVRSADATLIPEGAAIEVEGLTRGAKFLPQKLSVTLEEPLVAAEVFAPKGKGVAKAKPAIKTSTAKPGDKPAEGDKPATGDKPAAGDKPAGDKPAAKDDPFGVGKGGAKKPAAKKPVDKKDDKKPEVTNEKT